MTHAERSSTSEPSVSPVTAKKTHRRVVTILSLALTLAASSFVFSTGRTAAADQLSDAKAEAASISAKLQSDQAQIQTLTGEVSAADYQVSQLNGEIAANRAQVAKDQAKVNADQKQLRAEAISDYTNSDTTNQVSQMFSSDPNTSGIRSEYSSIATGNVTATIDALHTAQSQLEASQNALDQQQAQETATSNNLTAEENQASSLAQQDQTTLDSVNTTIHNLIAQQQAEEAAAAQAAAEAAFKAKLAASQRAQAQQAAAQQASAQQAASSGGGGGSSSGGGGSPAVASGGSLPPLPGGAAGAIAAAESQIGVPYVWGGETPGVGFDCSGLVQWAWAQVGVSLPRTSGAQFAATTQVPLADIAPGDLLFYGPDGADHVAMYIGGGMMVEAPETGQTVHNTPVRTGDDFAGVGVV
jgi:peptidoglycan DL-endopeptidase CwlO